MGSVLRTVAAAGLMLAITTAVAIPAAIALAPAEETTVAGQYLGVGATTPSGGWLGDLGEIVDGPPSGWPRAAVDGLSGPARLEQIGETTVDLDGVQVRGPLRPQLELGPLVRTRSVNEFLDPQEGPTARERATASVTDAFRTWYVRATFLVLLLTAAMLALGIAMRLWLALRHAARHDTHLTVGQVWHRHSVPLRVVAATTLAGTLAVWLGIGAVAAQDTRAGLADVGSLRDLVGASPVTLEPVGRRAEGFTGAVIGDSRASRLGGPPVEDGDLDDVACTRSTDSLAVELARLSPADQVLNLACPSATIDRGLLGSQTTNGRTVPAQVERLLRMPDLRFVVVVIGPNDLAWGDFLRYCYGVAECDDSLTSTQFDYRIAAFDRDYGDLLAALAALRGAPQVIVVRSYDVFDLDADCSDTEAAGHPGLDEDGLALLAARNDQLNGVLTAGAEAYGFTLATPQLRALCESGESQLGPDLQGLDDPYPFHPTGIGMVRLAATVLAALDPLPASSEVTPG